MSKSSRQQQTRERPETETAIPLERPRTEGTLAATTISTRTAARLSSRPDAHELDESSGPPSEEDEFFARGDSSFPPAAIDTEPDHTESDLPPPPSPQLIERRARLRRVVGAVVGAATLLTGLVGAKALAGHSNKVAVSDGSLSVPHSVVPSIALGSPTESATAANAAVVPADNTLTAGDTADENAAAIAPQPGETPATAERTENPKASNPTTNAARRLPIIDVEIPRAPDTATDEQWQSAARNLSSQDFNAADQAFAELGKRSDIATREAARLARAAWWTAHGKQVAVRPVLADLAENATTPSVKQHARELLRPN